MLQQTNKRQISLKYEQQYVCSRRKTSKTIANGLNFDFICIFSALVNSAAGLTLFLYEMLINHFKNLNLNIKKVMNSVILFQTSFDLIEVSPIQKCFSIFGYKLWVFLFFIGIPVVFWL